MPTARSVYTHTGGHDLPTAVLATTPPASARTEAREIDREIERDGATLRHSRQGVGNPAAAPLPDAAHEQARETIDWFTGLTADELYACIEYAAHVPAHTSVRARVHNRLGPLHAKTLRTWGEQTDVLSVLTSVGFDEAGGCTDAIQTTWPALAGILHDHLTHIVAFNRPDISSSTVVDIDQLATGYQRLRAFHHRYARLDSEQQASVRRVLPTVNPGRADDFIASLLATYIV